VNDFGVAAAIAELKAEVASLTPSPFPPKSEMDTSPLLSAITLDVDVCAINRKGRTAAVNTAQQRKQQKARHSHFIDAILPQQRAHSGYAYDAKVS
jgi:hypothetical protein